MSEVRCCVIIPVYNHCHMLRKVVTDALHITQHIIVVDDGSTDGSARTLEGLPVTVLTQPRNLGKGAAILKGAQEAECRGYTHIITMDADGQHKAADLPAFFTAVKRQPHAVIIGARDFNVPHVPGSSRFGRSFSRFWMFVQTGVSVSDMQSGFRAYPLSVLRTVHCTETRYSFEIEIVVRAAWAGFAIQEIPVQVYYPPKAERVSHFKSLADNARISVLNTRLTVRALAPVPFRRHTLHVEGRLSLLHPLRSLRTLSARASPRQLAASAAWSLFICTIPLLGLQTLLLLFVIGWRRLNRLCALLMMPLTWPPFVPGLAILIGYRVTHGNWLTQFTIQTLGYEAHYRFLDWMVGSFILAPILGVMGWITVFTLAFSYSFIWNQAEKRK